MNLNGLEKYFKTMNGEIVDFTQVNNVGWAPLICAFAYNKSQYLNLSIEQFDYLIQNSDLKQVTKDDWSPLTYALKYNKSNNLNLNNKQ